MKKNQFSMQQPQFPNKTNQNNQINFNEFFIQKNKPKQSDEKLLVLLHRLSNIQQENFRMKQEIISIRNQFQTFKRQNPTKQQFKALQIQINSIKNNKNIQILQKDDQEIRQRFKQTNKNKLKEKQKIIQVIGTKNSFQQQVLSILKSQSKKLDDQNIRFNQLESLMQDFNQQTKKIRRHYQQLQQTNKKFNMLYKFNNNDYDLLQIFEQIQQTIYQEQLKKYAQELPIPDYNSKKQKYKYSPQYNIIFRKYGEKFKKDKGDLHQNIEIHLNEDFNKKTYWIQIRTQKTMISKATGYLIKDKSQIKNFGGKEQNVILSVFLPDGEKKLARHIFKIQFINKQDSKNFISEVEKIIK